MKKENIALIYRVLIVIVATVSLYLNFKLMPSIQFLLYFTNLSNLLCLIYFTILIIQTIRKKATKDKKYYIVKGMVTMCITLTMLVYNLVLSSSEGTELFQEHMLECNLVHIVVPLMVIFDYIIFGEKGNLRKEYPYIWSLALFVYQIIIMIYSSLGGTFIGGASYPYFYMDISKFGVVGVIINCLLILMCFIGYGTFVQTLDNGLRKK